MRLVLVVALRCAASEPQSFFSEAAIAGSTSLSSQITQASMTIVLHRNFTTFQSGVWVWLLMSVSSMSYCVLGLHVQVQRLQGTPFLLWKCIRWKFRHHRAVKVCISARVANPLADTAKCLALNLQKEAASIGDLVRRLCTKICLPCSRENMHF